MGPGEQLSMTQEPKKMDLSKLMSMDTLIAAGIVFAAVKFAPNQNIRAAALGVAGVMVARQIPYVQDAV